MASLKSPPPPVPHTTVTFPHPNILLVVLARPSHLNAMPREQHFALEKLWDWYDKEPSLRCAIITGSGRAFCAGADLKEWDSSNNNNNNNNSNGEGGYRDRPSNRFPRNSGFGGLSNRDAAGMKPVIAAVNGICMGGGMEMVINCDMVIADPTKAKFALPEVTIGVVALAGALPRLARVVGRQRAMEMALGGKTYSATDMERWGLVNELANDVVQAAMRWAERIAGNSPDAVIVSREGVKMGAEGSVGSEQATDALLKGWYERIEKGENMVEGVRSFVEKRKPVWRDTKL